MVAFQAILFSLVHSIIQIVQWFTWKLYRIPTQNENYETSAHVCKIWFRSKVSEEFSTADDFIYTHEECVHPDIVLNDSVSLYTLTTTGAVFVDCDGIDVFDSKYDAFVYNTQFKMATRVIFMPIHSFHLISKQIVASEVPVIHLANHGRCGSTLLCKVFEKIPNSLSVSEMNAFTDIAEFSRNGQLERNDLKHLCCSTILFVMKHCNARKSKVLFIKCQSVALYITDIMIDAVPTVKHIYMYRNPVPFCRSYEKLYFINNWPLLDGAVIIFSGLGRHAILDTSPQYTLKEFSEFQNFTKFALTWITSTAAYQKLIEKGYMIKSLKYEDLLANPRLTICNLFQFVGLSDVDIPDVEAVMSKDSQVGTSFTSRKFNEKFFENKYIELTEELKNELNNLCNEYDVPLFWGKIELANKL